MVSIQGEYVEVTSGPWDLENLLEFVRSTKDAPEKQTTVK